METTEPKRRRRKKAVSALTATLPMVEGGEVPIPLEPPKRRKPASRKRKAVAPKHTVLDQPANGVFAGTPVRITAIGEKHVVVTHDQPLAAEGDLILRIPGLFAELSRLGGRPVSSGVIEVTRNAVFLKFALDALRHPVEHSRPRLSLSAPAPAPIRQPEKAPPIAEVPVIEADPQPLRHPRDTHPPLVPIVRLHAAPKRAARRWQPVAAAIAALLIVIAVVGYVKRPDEHFERAQKMIEAYEDGLMPSERDYSLPVYRNALRELSGVRPASVSSTEAHKLAEQIRRLIAKQHG